MGRYYVLRAYALAVGVVLLVVSLAGFAPSPPSPLPMSLPENLLHLGVGSLFVASALLMDQMNQLRTFLFGLGTLLVFGKVLIVVARWPAVGFEATVVGSICFFSGVGSLVVASFVGRRTPPEN